MKYIKKYFPIIIMVVILILFIFNFKKIKHLNGEVKKANKELMKIKKFNRDKFFLMGRRISSDSFKKHPTDKVFKWENVEKDYAVFLTLPKFNCGQCISFFVDNINRFESKNAEFYILGQKKNISEISNGNNIQFPAYYVKNFKWFEDKNLISGPIFLIVDTDTRKIVGSYFYKSSIMKSNQKYVLGFLNRLNK